MESWNLSPSGRLARYRTHTILMRTIADKKTKQWTGYKVHVTETGDPEQPIKKKGEPTEHFITEMFTTEAAQDEMVGLTEGKF